MKKFKVLILSGKEHTETFFETADTHDVKFASCHQGSIIQC